MTGVSLERLADTLYPKETPKDTHAYGTVESINQDGSYQVKLNASATTTRCAKLCDAEVGDRVMVVIQGNGHCAAIGRVGGTPQPLPDIELLWTNPNPKSNFAAQTLTSIPWQDYRFLIIDHYTANADSIAEHYETSVVTTANPTVWSWITCMREVPFARGVKFPADNQVQFGSQTYFQTYGNTSATLYDNWPFIVPAHIWGVR